MTLLIPDARRSVLGGLVDDGSLLAPDPPDCVAALERFRTLRESPSGWMLGRFVIPASMLEDLAAALVRTMRRGDTPWSIGVVLEVGDTGATSRAAAFHAAMDPAAGIGFVSVPPPEEASPDGVSRALSAGRGVHLDALPLLPIDVTRDPESSIDAIERSRADTLQPAGIWIDLEIPVDPELLVAAITRSARVGVPIVFKEANPPAFTTRDPDTPAVRFGAFNLIAVALSDPATAATRAQSVLLDTDPGSIAIGFGGLRRREGPGGSISPASADRGTILSIVSADPGAAIRSIVDALETGDANPSG